MHAHAAWVATCQHRRARGRADAAGGVEARKHRAFLCHPIDVGRAVLAGPETAKVAIAKIVAQDHDDVWLLRARREQGSTWKTGIGR